MFQVRPKTAVFVWNIGVLVRIGGVVATVEVGGGLLEAAAICAAKGIFVTELPIARVSVAVIEHRVHIDIEPVCPHDRHGALEFLPSAPVQRKGSLLVLAADVVIIERIESVGKSSGRSLQDGRDPDRRKTGAR